MDKRDTLLLACNCTEDRQLLSRVLRENYYLLEAGNGYQMDILLQQNRNCIAAIVADPEICEQLNSRDWNQIPVIMNEAAFPIRLSTNSSGYGRTPITRHHQTSL